jgi:hypothetical protein
MSLGLQLLNGPDPVIYPARNDADAAHADAAHADAALFSLGYGGYKQRDRIRPT